MANQNEYIIPLGVDTENLVNPMNEVIATLEKTEGISQETGKALQESFNKARKPIEDVDKALKPIQKDLSTIVDMGKKAGRELADAFSTRNSDPAKLEKALGGFLGKLGNLTAKIDIEVDDEKLAVYEKQLQNTTNELGQLEVALAMAKDALNSLDPDSEDFAELSDVIAFTESALNEFGNEIDTTVGKQQTLKSELRGIKNELAAMEAAGEAGSERFRELSERAGELEDQIGDTNAQIKILASDTAKFDALIEGVNGIVGGFAVAQGTMALFGTESEEVEKALLKVNAAMAILQGLQQVANTLNKDSAFSVIFLRNARITDAAATALQAETQATAIAATAAAVAATEALVIAEAQEAAASLAAAAASEAHAVANTQETAAALASALAAEAEAIALTETAAATVASTTAAETNAIAQAGQAAAMTGASVASNILRLALSGLGIGLIIAAVAYLVENWEELTASFKKFMPAGQSLTKWFDIGKAAVMGVGKAVLEFLIMPFKILIDLINGDLSGALEDLAKGLDVVANVTEGYNESLDKSAREHALEQKEIRMGQWKNQIEIAEAEGKDVYETQVKWYQNQIALMKKQGKDTADVEQELAVFMAKKRGEIAKDAADKAKKAADEAEKLRKENEKKAEAEAKRQSELARKFTQEAIDVRLSILEDGLEKELKIIANNAKKQIDDIKREGATTAEAVKAAKELIAAINAESAQLEIAARKKFNDELFALQLNYLTSIQGLGLENQERDLELENLAHIERMKQINDQYKNETELRNQLLEAEAKFTEQNRKNIALDWLQRSLSDEEERQILLIETAAKYAGGGARVEKQKQLAILATQAEFAEQYLLQLQNQGEDENSLVYLRAKAAAEAAQKGLKDGAKEGVGKFDLFDSIFGDMPDDKKQFAIDTAKQFLSDLSGIMDGITEQYQRQIDKKQESIDQYTTEIEDLESRLDDEKELRENGLANNVDVIQKEIEVKKAARDEEIRQREELQKKQLAIQKAQMAAETAMQLVGMISSSVNIFEKSTEFFGPLGIPIAIAAISAMFGAFAFAKVKAAQSVNDGQKFRDGGWINGDSHESGGVAYVSKDGSNIELEGGEFVMNKKSARKFGKVIEAMNRNENLSLRDILAMGMMESFGVGINPEELFTDMEKSNKGSNEINSYSFTFAGSDEMKSIDKNLKYLAEEKRNEVKKWEDDDYYYTKIGTRTTKIKKR